MLVHYDDSLLLTLSCDASPYGIEAVLSHTMPDGDEHPISFASRTLRETGERGPGNSAWYSQVLPVSVWPEV